MNKTGIEWAEYTWNPVSGCSPISSGCKNCYAARMAKRLAGRCGYPADDPFRVTLHPERLREPLARRKPSIIFVCSMSDLFHEAVPDRFVEAVFAVMEMAAHHRFLVLTKRPRRAQERGTAFPSNVGLGFTVEIETERRRLFLLLNPSLPMRFVSCEPLLGPIDLRPWIGHLDWIIAGAETGPGARPCNPEWALDLMHQALAAKVPFLWKRFGNGSRLLAGREWNQTPAWLKEQEERDGTV